MKILVVYDTKFGNTERIARSIASGFGPANHVTIESISGTEELDPKVDLIVIGGPTQAHGASQAMKSFLARLPEMPGTKFATFDTRYDRARWLTGAASGVIADGLKRHGCMPVAPGESFFIEHSEGPLLPGEEDRAASWGATLAGRA